MARTSLEELLQECVEPLRPYLDQLVVAGGWVPYLYTKVYGGLRCRHRAERLYRG